jgi:hypothetical protein
MTREQGSDGEPKYWLAGRVGGALFPLVWLNRVTISPSGHLCRCYVRAGEEHPIFFQCGFLATVGDRMRNVCRNDALGRIDGSCV